MQPFTIFKEFLKEFKLTTPSAPEVFYEHFEGETTANIAINVDAKRIKEELYQVDLIVKAHPTAGDKTIFSLKCVYCALMGIVLPENAEKEKKYILLKVVPRILYPVARDLITHMVIRAGFPPLPLPAEYYQDELELREGTEPGAGEDDELDDITEISYASVVDSFSERKEGADFVEFCKKEGLVPEQQYDDTPMAKLFYRFIAPFEYNCPVFYDKRVEKSSKNIFLKMLMSDARYTTKLVADEDSEIDVYISGGDYYNTKLTVLNETQFDIFIKMLVVGSWANRTMALLRSGYEESDDANKFNSELLDGVLPTREKYRELIAKFCKAELLDSNMADEWYNQLEEINARIAAVSTSVVC